VAPRYDFLNALLSAGINSLWETALAQQVIKNRAEKILDAACGSGAIIRRLFRLSHTPVAITGVDFCPPLLAQARQNKALRRFLETGRLELIEADALNLPFDNESFDAITVAYGLRNFCDRPKFYAEALRVLKPGGRLYILEFSQPCALFRPAYRLYLEALPHLAQILGAPRDAYRYLNDTIRAFPNADALGQEILCAGFKEVSCRRLTCGIVALHTAPKA
jgi:demethylmenaquinone methyltransferase/2-methoxy-6-polyprenyl-1,4-benzoquinol methylase